MNENSLFKVGEKAKVSPLVTNTQNWIEGEIIKVEENPFKGIVISIKTPDGNIFFDQEHYFQKAS